MTFRFANVEDCNILDTMLTKLIMDERKYDKSIDENSDWYGGITYRTAVSGGLKNGELRQLPASHFTKAGSKVVFVTYAE